MLSSRAVDGKTQGFIKTKSLVRRNGRVVGGKTKGFIKTKFLSEIWADGWAEEWVDGGMGG
jgi:hypothetical protein